LIITGPKNDHCSVWKQTGFVDQSLLDFAKMTLTQVIDCDSTRVESPSFSTWLESSRVTIFLNVTRVESESPKFVTRVESLTRVTLSLHSGRTKTAVRH